MHSWIPKISVKNYRCFGEQTQSFELPPGFTGLVGANNSGKSSILRLIYDLKPLFSELSYNPQIFANLLRGTSDRASHDADDHDALFCDQNDGDMVIRIDSSEMPGAKRKRSLAYSIEISLARESMMCSLSAPDLPEINSGNWKESGSHKWVVPPRGPVRRKGQVQAIYDFTPVFHSLGVLANSTYHGPFRNPVNYGQSENYFGSPVGQSFIRRWQALKAGSSRSGWRTALAITEEIRDVFGFRTLELNTTEGESGLQVVVNGRPYSLLDVGAGLAQFIMLLVTAAVSSPSLAMIDEPELHLHPAMQRQLLMSMAKFCSHGVLFSTHNIGLIRSSADVAYAIRSDGADNPSRIEPVEPTSAGAELMGELGAAALTASGASRVLLVEGPHDVKVFHELLRKVSKLQHYILVPLGGSSGISKNARDYLPHLKEFGLDLHAVIDSERDAKGDSLSARHLDFVQACHDNGVDVHVLERRSIENYFPERALRSFHKGLSALGPYDRTGGWPKGDNWKFASKTVLADVAATDLGQWLQGLPGA